MYYNVCPHCGAYLDPGERCDCGENGDKKEPPPVVATPGAAEQYETADGAIVAQIGEIRNEGN